MDVAYSAPETRVRVQRLDHRGPDAPDSVQHVVAGAVYVESVLVLHSVILPIRNLRATNPYDR